MAQMDRGDALDEAAFAAMETVISLMRAADERRSFARLELIHEALASARATVVAAGYAFTTLSDAERVAKVPPAKLTATAEQTFVS
jgi:hypothetical protein